MVARRVVLLSRMGRALSVCRARRAQPPHATMGTLALPRVRTSMTASLIPARTAALAPTQLLATRAGVQRGGRVRIVQPTWMSAVHHHARTVQ